MLKREFTVSKPSHSPKDSGCINNIGFDLFTVVIMLIEAFWVVTLCNLVSGYQCCKRTYCRFLQFKRESNCNVGTAG